MLKHIFSFRYLANYTSMFSIVDKQLSGKESSFNEYFSGILESLKNTQKQIKECKVFYDNRIKPLENISFVERIKLITLADVHEKICNLQEQCWSLQTRVFNQKEHLQQIQHYFDKHSDLEFSVELEDSVKQSVSFFRRRSSFMLKKRNESLSKKPLRRYVEYDECYDYDDYDEESYNEYNSIRQMEIYHKSFFGFITKLTFVMFLLFAITFTFFSVPIASFVSSLTNVSQEYVIGVINIVKIVSYAILSIPILIITAFFLINWIDNLKDGIVKFRMRDDKVTNVKHSKAVRIILFVLGASFLATSIMSQNIIYFIAPLIGITNSSAIPQTMLSIMALIIALLFMFGSLYNAPTIRNIFLAQDIEQKYLLFKDEILEKMQVITSNIDKYKSETNEINDSNISAINELRTYTYDQIQDLNTKILEKIHQFELAHVESIYQCKLDISVRLEHMQSEIDSIKKQVDNVDSIIDELKNQD